jgi:hypothetical protein
MEELLVGDDFSEIGDMFFDAGDFLRPGGEAFVGEPGGVFALGFGEGFEGVLQLLLEGGTGHGGRLSLVGFEFS